MVYAPDRVDSARNRRALLDLHENRMHTPFPASSARSHSIGRARRTSHRRRREQPREPDLLDGLDVLYCGLVP